MVPPFDTGLVWTAHESMRLLIVVLVPLTAAVAVAGLLGGLLQGVTRVHDHALGYTIRLVAAAVVVLALFSTVSQSLTEMVGALLQRGTVISQR